MTVLITGAGMVGTQAARILLDRGENPVLFDIAPSMDNIERIVGLSRVKLVKGDVLEPFEIIEAIQGEKVERIIHTATLFGLTQGTQQRPYIGIKVNIMGTANIFEAARLMGVKKVVFTSSGQVHSRSSTARGGEPRSPFFYATAKYAGEQLGLNYMDNCGIDFVALRLNTVFGPWLGPISGGAGKLFKDLADLALSGKPEVIEETAPWPMAMRPAMTFTYSKDAAQAAVLAAYADNPEQRVYDINMGKTYSLAQIVSLLNKVYPSSRLTVKEGGIEGRPPMSADISQAKQDLGYHPEYEMEAALRDYLTWIQAN